MIREDFNELVLETERRKKAGDFLFSTNERSDFWIDLTTLARPLFYKSLVNISRVFIRNIYKEYGKFSVIYRRGSLTSDIHFGFERIILDAIFEEGLIDEVSLVRSEKTGMQKGIQKYCIIITSMSSHLGSVSEILSDLKAVRTSNNEEIKCIYCYSFICGELKSIEAMLSKYDIPIIPLIVTLGLHEKIWPVIDIASSGYEAFEYLVNGDLLRYFDPLT